MPQPSENRLLAQLPQEAQAEIAALANAEDFTPNQLMLEENSPITRVYFPTNSIISVVGSMEDGRMAESYTAGRDGMFGESLLLGVERIALRVTCQVPGTMFVMSARDFLSLAQRHEALRTVVMKYIHCVFTFTGQCAACNLLHDLTARCARWLLLVNDRVQSDVFTLTQEILATMLGVHRPAVSLAASSLQHAGFIRYSRGRMTITDRPGLESAACECYNIVNNEFLKYFPLP